ncbi:sulfur reduction protein DsrE [bacterium]|nr:MAG: sulfur reduction protein DsrE [bacterium]
MKIKITLILIVVICFSAIVGNAQTTVPCGGIKTLNKFNPQKVGIVISSNDPETVWNAFRIANYSIEQGDTVSVFLLGKGVESPSIVSKDFDVKGIMETFSNTEGKIFACGTCMQLRHTKGAKLCPISSLSDLYVIIKQSEILLTF